MLGIYVLIGIAILVGFIAFCYILYKLGFFNLLMYIADAILGDDDSWGGGGSSGSSHSDSSSFGGGGDFGGGGGGASW